MADRYWVGGTASWDGTAGTKWAASSGGPGGETVPTSADDVYFSAASTGTVTIATGNTGAKSINCTGFTGTLAGTAAITVSGNITIVAGMTYSYTGTITINATSTLITGGKTFRGLTINAGSGTVTLGDAFTSTTTGITVTSGTFNTSNYNVTAVSINSASTGSTRTITLGSSTVTLSDANFPVALNSTNLTFNADTSTIKLTGNGASFSISGSITFYNVEFNSTGNNTSEILGTNTFNNLTVVSPSAGIRSFTFGADQTINGTLTTNGTTIITRNFLTSNGFSVRTLTVNTLSADNCDFRNITISGAAAGTAPSNAGDCGNNSGIVFPAAKTVYWNLAGSQTWSATGWAPGSGGTPALSNFPLAQDTAVFDDTGAAGTVSVNGNWNIGTFDASNRTSAMTFSFSTSRPSIHGNWKFGTGVTNSTTTGLVFFTCASGTQTITSNGVTFNVDVNCRAIATTSSVGTVQLADALTVSSTKSLNIDGGTFSAVSYNVTAGIIDISANTLRTVNMGSGTWTATSTGTVWDATTATNLTVNKETANILLSDTSTTSRVFVGNSAVQYNKLTIGGTTGTSSLRIDSGNFTELASTKTVAHTIRLNANNIVIGKWSVTGTVGNVVTFNSSTTSTRRTFSLGSVTSGIDYLAVQDIGVSVSDRFFVGTNSTNNGNNLNVYFRAAPPPSGNFLNFLG